jgi:asparagine synthase (glutamine-hydrolysing)
VVKYWQLGFASGPRRRLSDYMEEYRALLTDAIRLRLRSDVPLALTFSGGVDSGTIAALCARELGAPLRCYTIDYHTEADPSEETQIAREVAELLDLDWTHIHYDYHSDLLDELPRAYAPYDQPCQQLPLVYAHRLYQAIKPHATVVLSGNGADELFTGYIGDEAIYRKGLMLRALAPLRPLMRHLPISAYLRLPLHEAHALSLRAQAGLFDDVPGAREALVDTSEWLVGEAEAAGAHLGLDLKMLNALTISSTDSNFRIPDISGMMAQVEVRSPFLDYRLVEFAARLPHRYRVGNPLTAASAKFLPKRYYERHVPRRIARSRKKGMGWNLRWDRSIARDPRFEPAFSGAWTAMDRVGIDSRRYRDAWRNYVADSQAGMEFSTHAKMMMNGLMLGAWLQRRSEPCASHR